MDIISASTKDYTLEKLIKQVTEAQSPLLIKGEINDIVVISKQDWDAIQETIYLTSIPGMKESILEGGKTPIDECTSLKNLEW